ncbi:PREDICTED: uncharacterized protein LOC109472624 isoform X2 [Branchiostoma belcheri]|uniref:Uncharacterized protein LOC109472624 isoform X1 n=1 Tax=Branchiostoma belcheri TaxID=7741 RepID=A0A6P4ZA92_BRABE|nr:PREDICTED: uncharacterized protein LOC109472624 isoform X1 [Branchiostoma belcheri]XP_019628007.1 PREDICTED: uncharacterized protein LOC109472624 isoform X2 [Branchiostoma belcheri]
MAETMDHSRHLSRLYKCAECEFTVSHELMVYVLRHFFRCTSNKYVDELEVWSPPHLKINGTVKSAGPSENAARERCSATREEKEDSRTFANTPDRRRGSTEDSRTFANTPDQRRGSTEDSRTFANTPDQRRGSEDSRTFANTPNRRRGSEDSRIFANTPDQRRGSEDSRSLHSSHSSTRQEEESTAFANTHSHTHKGVSEDSRTLHFSNIHNQRGSQNISAAPSYGGDRATSIDICKRTEIEDVTPVVQVSGMAVSPMVWMVQPNTTSQLQTWAKTSPTVPSHAVLQKDIVLEGNGQGRQQSNQGERRQTPCNSETEVGEICEEEDENEEGIGLNLSCSPVPLCNTGDTGDQIVTMVTTPPITSLTQTPSMPQQLRHPSFDPPVDRMRRGRPQKPPYSTNTSVADMEQPKNTKRMNRWAVRVLNTWANKRNGEATASSSGQDLKPVPTDWVAMTVEQLDHWLSQFVSEVRRDDGQYYPYNTLYLMLTGINRYLRNDCRKDVNILAKDDGRFLQLRQAMETQKKSLIELGVGMQEKRRHDMELFPHGIEARLWESKVFSLEKDLSISYAVFYYTTKLFGVSSGEEHHSLVAEQFSVGCDHMGKFVSFNRLGKKSKTTKAYAVPSDPYCPVLLYEVYLGYIPPIGPFYRRLQRDPEGRLYFGPPVGKNSLATYLNNIKRLAVLNTQVNQGACSTGPHPIGPNPTGPHPTVSHPIGPHPIAPHPTCSTVPDLSLENSPATSSSDSGEAAKRHHSQSMDASECSTEPSPKRIHTWNFDPTLSSYTPLNQS